MYVASLMTSLRYLKWSIILVFESNLYLRSWSFSNFDIFFARAQTHHINTKDVRDFSIIQEDGRMYWSYIIVKTLSK